MIQQLKTKLASCKQEGQAIVEYYGKLRSMWEVLMSSTKNPIFASTWFTCGAAIKLIQDQEKDKVHQFLIRLDDEVFGTTRSNIVSMEPLPTLNRIYITIIQEEWYQNVTWAKEERTEAVAFVVQSPSQLHNTTRAPNNLDKPYCNNWSKLGHEKRSIFCWLGILNGGENDEEDGELDKDIIDGLVALVVVVLSGPTQWWLMWVEQWDLLVLQHQQTKKD